VANKITLTKIGAVGAAAVTRLWPEGQPLDMTLAADGAPADFTWQGQRHQVAEITQVWRVDAAWWQGRVWRSYFKLRTDTGLLVEIYQDLLDEEWFLQRLYD
jgi:hypothetical protein